MREPVTDEVVEQLRAVLRTGRVDDPVNWMAVQAIAWEEGYGDLQEFVLAADAATYYEALEEARDDPSIGGAGTATATRGEPSEDTPADASDDTSDDANTTPEDETDHRPE